YSGGWSGWPSTDSAPTTPSRAASPSTRSWAGSTPSRSASSPTGRTRSRSATGSSCGSSSSPACSPIGSRHPRSAACGSSGRSTAGPAPSSAPTSTGSTCPRLTPGAASAGWSGRGLVDEDARLPGGSLAREVDLGARRRLDGPVANRIVGLLHPSLQPAAHLLELSGVLGIVGEGGRLGRAQDQAVELIGRGS